MNSPMRGLGQAARIRLELKRQIDSGLLAVGAKLPSERELAALFDTTRITLKEALQSLEAEGCLYREDRRGWFVAPPRLRYRLERDSHFQGMADAQQRLAATRVLAAGLMLASPEQCRDLAMAPLSQVLQIRRLRSLDGRVVLYAEHYLRPERFPGILQLDLSQSLTRLYRQHYGLDYGHVAFDICPGAARGAVAQALMLAEGSPILLIKRVNRDRRGQLLDCDYEYWRHDAVHLSLHSGEPPPAV
nr:UTRA domain-containing protein [Chromobacterium sp. ASV5]